MVFSVGDEQVKSKATLETAGITMLESDAKLFCEYFGIAYIQKYTPSLDAEGKQIFNADKTPKMTYNGIKRKKMSDAISTLLHLTALKIQNAKPNAEGIKVVELKFKPSA
jgi:hypothetical protein